MNKSIICLGFAISSMANIAIAHTSNPFADIKMSDSLRQSMQHNLNYMINDKCEYVTQSKAFSDANEDMAMRCAEIMILYNAYKEGKLIKNNTASTSPTKTESKNNTTIAKANPISKTKKLYEARVYVSKEQKAKEKAAKEKAKAEKEAKRKRRLASRKPFQVILCKDSIDAMKFQVAGRRSDPSETCHVVFPQMDNIRYKCWGNCDRSANHNMKDWQHVEVGMKMVNRGGWMQWVKRNDGGMTDAYAKVISR